MTANTHLSFTRSVTTLFLFQLALGVIMTLIAAIMHHLFRQFPSNAHWGIISFMIGSLYYGYWHEKRKSGTLAPYIKKLSLWISLIHLIVSAAILGILATMHGALSIFFIIAGVLILSVLFVIMYVSCYFLLKRGIKWRHKELNKMKRIPPVEPAR